MNAIKKVTHLREQQHTLEGWIERVDHSNRRLHIRTGSRDKFGCTVLVPEQCEITHNLLHLQLHSLLPCDPVQIVYEEDDLGGRIARTVEIC